VPGFTQERLEKAHATYCGEISMVDTWLGCLLRRTENMGLMENTAIIFTSDHGFYFGEHGGLFGKMVYEMGKDGAYPKLDDWDKQVEGGIWAYSPLYEEIVNIPLLISIPGISAGVYRQVTSAVDVMPTVLDLLSCDIPEFVEGQSLLSKITDSATSGREFTVSSIPFANPGDPVRSVDNFLRMLKVPTVTTITTEKYALFTVLKLNSQNSMISVWIPVNLIILSRINRMSAMNFINTWSNLCGIPTLQIISYNHGLR
jgi:hypothetical protein